MESNPAGGLTQPTKEVKIIREDGMPAIGLGLASAGDGVAIVADGTNDLSAIDAVVVLDGGEPRGMAATNPPSSEIDEGPSGLILDTAGPKPGYIKSGKHSITTNDQAEKSVTVLTKEVKGNSMLPNVNAWSRARQLNATTPLLEFVDTQAAGVPAGVPAPALPPVAGETDFVLRSRVNWTEQDSANGPNALQNNYDLRLSLPGGTVINDRQVRYLDSEPVSAAVVLTDQMDSARGAAPGATTLETRTVASAVASVLPDNTYGRNLEALAGYLVQNRVPYQRYNNVAVYTKLLHAATVANYYEQAGLVPAFVAPVGVFNTSVTLINIDPIVAQVPAAVRALSGALTQGSIVIRAGIDMALDDIDLLASVLANGPSLFGPGVGQSVPLINAVTFPPVRSLVIIKRAADVPVWIGAVPTAARLYDLAQTLAVLRGEIDDFTCGLSIVTELLGGVTGPETLVTYGPVGSQTVLDATYASRGLELPVPMSMNWLSMLLPDNKPRAETRTEFLEFSSMSNAERWHSMGLVSVLTGAAATAAFKDLNMYGHMLDILATDNAGVTYQPKTWLETAVTSVQNITKPGLGGENVPWIYRAVAAILADCHNVIVPVSAHAGKQWCGRNTAAGSVLPPFPAPPAVQASPVLYGPLFGVEFPTHSSPMCALPWIREGSVPRCWGFVGQDINIDISREIGYSPGADRGVLMFMGTVYAESEFRGPRCAQYHAYPARVANALGVYLAGAIPLTQWSANIAPNMKERWVPGVVGGFVPPLLMAGSHVIEPAAVRTVDWQNSQMLSYSVSLPPGALFSTISQVFQRGPVSRNGDMSFGIFRPKPVDVGGAPAGLEPGWADDFF